MKYLTPTRYRVTSSLKKFRNEATGNDSYRCFVIEEGKESDLEPYFLNSRHQTDNTIVHAKMTCGQLEVPFISGSPYDPVGWLATGSPNVAWYVYGNTSTLVFDYTSVTYVEGVKGTYGDPITARSHSVTVYTYNVENGGMYENSITAAWTSHFGDSDVTHEEAKLKGVKLQIYTLVRSLELPVAVENATYAHDVCLAVATSFKYPLDGSSHQRMSSVIRYPGGGTPPKPPCSALLFNEDELFFTGLPPHVACAAYAGQLEKACYQAYLDACNNAPRFSDNMISNIIEALGAIARLLKGKGFKLPSSWAEGWLFYRYAYSTTKMDIDQASDYLRRLPTLPSEFKCYGTSSFLCEDALVTVRCRIKLHNDTASRINSLTHDLRTYGLSLQGYQIWDLIPYSFIVDWFLPIGSLLQEGELVELVSSYALGSPCYSLTYNRKLDSQEYNVYSRWIGTQPSAIDGLLWYEDHKPSKKTVGKRAIDSIALIMG